MTKTGAALMVGAVGVGWMAYSCTNLLKALVARGSDDKLVARKLLRKLKALEEAVRVMEKQAPIIFRVAQYNILASYLGNNCEPWFLYGGLSSSDADELRAKQIAKKHVEKGPDGKYLNVGWPAYVKDILTEKEQRAVEEYDAKVFAWAVREPKIMKTLLSLDADLCSLVELDRYDEFAPKFEAAGYGSIWFKRPRQASFDGCAILYRKSKMDLIGSRGIELIDSITKDGECRTDRVALLGIFKFRQATDSKHMAVDNRIIFVSTHLARNPENEKQTLLRIRQVSQLMLELKKFADEHDASQVPVVISGDWNSDSMQQLRVMALALCSLQSLFQEVHPLLLGGNDVPTSRTSFTMRRQTRIDYLMYQETLLRPIARGPFSVKSPVLIPDEEHGSDHLPVWADFQVASLMQEAEECAKVYVRCLLDYDGWTQRPMTEFELELAFSFFDVDGSNEIDESEIRRIVADMVITNEIDHILNGSCLFDSPCVLPSVSVRLQVDVEKH